VRETIIPSMKRNHMEKPRKTSVGRNMNDSSKRFLHEKTSPLFLGPTEVFYFGFSYPDFPYSVSPPKENPRETSTGKSQGKTGAQRKIHGRPTKRLPSDFFWKRKKKSNDGNVGRRPMVFPCSIFSFPRSSIIFPTTNESLLGK
jgi:hypothetical protein